MLKERYERVVGLCMFVLFFFVGLWLYFSGGDVNRLFLVGGLWIVASVWGFALLLT